MNRKLRSLWTHCCAKKKNKIMEEECHLEVRNICCNNMFSPISVHYFISKAHTLSLGSRYIQICLCQSQFSWSPSGPVESTWCLRTLPLTGAWENRCHDRSPLVSRRVKCKRYAQPLPAKVEGTSSYSISPQSSARLQTRHCRAPDVVQSLALDASAYGSLFPSGLKVSCAFSRSVFFTSGLSDGSAAQGEGAACPQAPLLGRRTS